MESYMQKSLKEVVKYLFIVLIFKGVRSKLIETDFSEILNDDMEKELKDTAKLSMGSDVTDQDELYIKSLAE